MELEQMVTLAIEVVVLGLVGWLLKSMLSKVSIKLDKVLSNQQRQEVVIAEIKKDVHRVGDESKETSEKVEDIQKRVNSLEIDMATIKGQNG